jgi:hypothetical protein
MVKTLEGIQCKSEGEKATLTMSIKADAASLVMPMLFGVRSVPQPVPPPVAPNPPQVVK